MFTTPCFIRKNSKELRSRLVQLGYESSPIDIDKYPHLETDPYIYPCPKYRCVNNGHKGEIIGDISIDILINTIECENENQFLAIAALRDDTDIYQWFTDGVVFYKCEYDKFHFFTINPNDVLDIEDEAIYFHKAIISEILEHFKTK